MAKKSPVCGPLPSEEDIFAVALCLPVKARRKLLDAACAGEQTLRRRVEALLAAHEQAGDLLDLPRKPVDSNPVTP